MGPEGAPQDAGPDTESLASRRSWASPAHRSLEASLCDIPGSAGSELPTSADCPGSAQGTLSNPARGHVCFQVWGGVPGESTGLWGLTSPLPQPSRPLSHPGFLGALNLGLSVPPSHFLFLSSGPCCRRQVPQWINFTNPDIASPPAGRYPLLDASHPAAVAGPRAARDRGAVTRYL